ncbi:MAG TPA: transglutaminase family protein [Hyphomonadaceae bacterium]|nr:transglutaminase family protein [Hyphomonadaceae bacterium]HPN05789.1 transglutaminase family protein [Hyphomonadaceae bacterium]
MRLTVRHATTYAYDPPADRCALRLRLYPPSFTSQRVLSWKVSVNGQAVPALMTTATGDKESIWTKSNVGEEVLVLAEGEVEVDDTAGVVRGLRDGIRPQVFLRPTPLTEADEKIEKLAASIADAAPLEQMHSLFNAVADAIEYKPATTTSTTTAAQALKAGQGVCQDHAHVFISAARTLKVPARYVVGYLFAPDAKLAETHAWAEAWVKDIGWVGFDAANRLCPTDHYVRLGCGLDAVDAAPIRGNVFGSRQERLSASVDIGTSTGQSQTQNQGDGVQSQTQQ